jgi:hypothetical protein
MAQNVEQLIHFIGTGKHEIRISKFARLGRVNFEFLISNFEFPDKQKIKNSKACLAPACPG